MYIYQNIKKPKLISNSPMDLHSEFAWKSLVTNEAFTGFWQYFFLIKVADMVFLNY